MSATPQQISWREELRGFVAHGCTTPTEGDREGWRIGATLSFRLEMTIADVEAFMADPYTTAAASGSLDSAVFGRNRELVGASFNLFVPDGSETLMIYRLPFLSEDDEPFTLMGTKYIGRGGWLRAWSETTTLYVRVLAGHLVDDAGPDVVPVAAGIVHITLPLFARQLTTFRAKGPSLTGRAKILARFGRYFVGSVLSSNR